MSDTGYLMDHPGEAARLEKKTDFDLVRQQLHATGLRAGMRCLDVGAATGAVARIIAAETGEGGSVLAFDGSAERLAAARALAKQEGLKNIEFQQGNIYDADLPSASFDFSWSRFLFEYLERPEDALQRILQATKKGGTVVLADLDGNCFFNYPMASEFSEKLERFGQALRGRFDPYIGRKLHHLMASSGEFEGIKVNVQPYHLVAGAASAEVLGLWKLKLEGLRAAGERVFGKDGYNHFIRLAVSHFEDPMTLTYSTLFTVWGVRR